MRFGATRFFNHQCPHNPAQSSRRMGAPFVLVDVMWLLGSGISLPDQPQSLGAASGQEEGPTAALMGHLRHQPPPLPPVPTETALGPGPGECGSSDHRMATEAQTGGSACRVGDEEGMAHLLFDAAVIQDNDVVGADDV